MLIRIKDERECGKYRQGSGLAECLLCRICGVLVGVYFRSDGRLYGAVNSRAVDARADFAADQPVSPKKLSAGEKMERWQDIWFPNVSVINVGA